MGDISTLPTESLIVIFGKLSAKDLASCHCVCSGWNSLATAPSLWKPLCLSRWKKWKPSRWDGPVNEGCWSRIYRDRHRLDQEALKALESLPHPKRRQSALRSIVSCCGEDVEELLFAESRREGPMTLGRRYWAGLAHQKLMAACAAEKLTLLKGMESPDSLVDEGALVLVRAPPSQMGKNVGGRRREREWERGPANRGQRSAGVGASLPAPFSLRPRRSEGGQAGGTVGWGAGKPGRGPPPVPIPCARRARLTRRAEARGCLASWTTSPPSSAAGPPPSPPRPTDASCSPCSTGCCSGPVTRPMLPPAPAPARARSGCRQSHPTATVSASPGTATTTTTSATPSCTRCCCAGEASPYRWPSFSAPSLSAAGSGSRPLGCPATS
mmetsp:Transcript_18473/g.44146  ORF Transcript_18473/g.44146 Transcript_18473/m.44146 type:complete len:384 (+) Transcript_18473:211-1362(+)